MTLHPVIAFTNHPPARIHCHFIDRELLEAVGWAPTPTEALHYIKTLSIATDSELVCVLPHLWESFAILEPIYAHLAWFYRSHVLKCVCTQSTFPEFVETRAEIYAHDLVRYQCYFRAPPSDLLEMSPSILKHDSTTDFLARHILERAPIRGFHSLLRYAEQAGRDQVDVFRVIESRLVHRSDEAITYALFRDELKKAGDHRAKYALRRWISELYTAHYLASLCADLATGIDGLKYFDGLADLFPLLDIPLLSDLLQMCGLGTPLAEDVKQSTWWQEFAVHRGSPAHVLVVDALMQVLATLAFQVPVVHSRTTETFRAYARQMLARLPRHDTRPTDVNVQLFRVASYLRSLLIQLGSRYIPDVGTKLMTQRSHAPDGRVLLLTATPVETKAVERVIAEMAMPTVSAGGYTVYECGNIGTNHVMCAQTEMGSGGIGGSQMVTADLIRELKPSAIIAVGICFGLRPAKQKLGHVIISKQVRQYEAARVGVGPDGEMQVHVRGDRATAPVRMTSAARAAAHHCRGITCHAGLLLSGEKLVNHPDLRALLLNYEPEAIAGEMEAAGIYVSATAGKVDWVIVKGICDWGDGTKKNFFQERAAQNAAEVVLKMLIQSTF